MNQVLQWVIDHPGFMVAFGWPLVTAVINYFGKARSPEEYLAMHPVKRAVLKFFSGAGLDPVKTTKAMQELVEGAAESRHSK